MADPLTAITATAENQPSVAIPAPTNRITPPSSRERVKPTLLPSLEILLRPPVTTRAQDSGVPRSHKTVQRNLVLGMTETERELFLERLQLRPVPKKLSQSLIAPVVYDVSRTYFLGANVYSTQVNNVKRRRGA